MKSKLFAINIEPLLAQLENTVIGQRRLLERMLMALLADGHLLLEGVPGLAKTLAVKTIASVLNLKFQRIQFTPDLLPSDIIGTMIFNQKTGEFTAKKGSIFANLILADEINRAPAKVQSALLEAMQERQVTIGDTTFPLEQPFIVMATQNPLEHEGAYPLPEAQTDRFFMKLLLDYPSLKDEQTILRKSLDGTLGIGQQPLMNFRLEYSQLNSAKDAIKEIYIDSKIEKYILSIVDATRNPDEYSLPHLKLLIAYGASPRGTINLAAAARIQAFFSQRDYVVPEDVRSVGNDVLRHRLGVSFEAEAENVTPDMIINDIFKKIPIP
jgi:MoxR-like ATPase